MESSTQISKEKNINKVDIKNNSTDFSSYKTEELDDLYAIMVREKFEDLMREEIAKEIERRIEGGKSTQKNTDEKNANDEGNKKIDDNQNIKTTNEKKKDNNLNENK